MTDKGVWDLQDVRDKLLQDDWHYVNDVAPYTLWCWGNNQGGLCAQNNTAPAVQGYSSPVQVPGDWRGVQGGKGSWERGKFAIKNNGTLWAWGRGGDTGGWGTNASPSLAGYSSPTQLPGTTWSNNNDALGIGGYDMNASVKTNGQLWVWGTNYQGALGQNITGSGYSNNPGNRSSPVQIPGTNWKTVTSGQGFNMLATKTDGTLWGWGGGGSGQLALNSTSQRSSPTQIGTDSDWDKVYSDGDGSWGGAIKTDGTLWGWGANSKIGWKGQAGPSDEYRSSPIQLSGGTWSWARCGNKMMFAIKTDGTLWSWGAGSQGRLMLNDGQVDKSSPCQVGTATNWSSTAVGSNFALAVKDDGTLWGAGYNEKGVLLTTTGINTRNSSPVQLPGSWVPRLGTTHMNSVMCCRLPS